MTLNREEIIVVAVVYILSIKAQTSICAFNVVEMRGEVQTVQSADEQTRTDPAYSSSLNSHVYVGDPHYIQELFVRIPLRAALTL